MPSVSRPRGARHNHEDRYMPTQVDDAVQLIKMEYAEMPDLKLTFFQAQRLWNLSSELCDDALRTLDKAGFLQRTADGCYIRRHESQPGLGADSFAIRRMPAD